MKLKKSQIKEFIRQAISEVISEDIMDKEIENPKTGNKIKVRTALQLPDEHPANKKAKGMVAKSSIDKDDVGGPAYPNVKKGVKTSKQAKGDDKEKSKPKKGKIKSDPFTKDDVGGPSYADVPKGAKSSKQAKDMKAKEKNPVKSGPKWSDMGLTGPSMSDRRKSAKQAKVIKQNDATAEKINPNLSNAKDLVMRGLADDIDDFINHHGVFFTPLKLGFSH